METKINTNAIPDGGIDIEKLKAGIVPEVSHLETKEDASAKLQEAKDYTDTKVADLVNSAPETLDTLKEVADAIQENEAVVDALNSAIGNKANSSDVYNKQEVDGKIDAATITFQYAANDSEVPAERVPGVVYLVGNEKVMITFTIVDGATYNTYQAEEGMTWREFLNSNYDHHDITIDSEFVKFKSENIHNGYIKVQADDIIISNFHHYNTNSAGGEN
ncbi:MAG: hypothetical protein E7066_06175 [Lentimicrobiaceae bacterium]|nr:hypothetical protein [Lentimicrobiaceae bacterium]